MAAKNRLKVLFLPAWYPSEINPVAGIFIREHAKAASLHNDVVVLYAYPDPSPQRRHLPAVSEVTEDGIRTIRVRYGGIIFYWWTRITGRGKQRRPSSGTTATTAAADRALSLPRVVVDDLLYYWSVFSAFRSLVREGWKPDVIHAHVFTAGVPAVMLGKLYRIPVVITERWSVFPRGLLSRTQRMKARFALKRASVVLTVSTALREAIESYGIHNDFRIMQNGVNTEVFYPLSPTETRALERKKRLLLVAGLTPVKGVPYLLEALREVRETRQDFVLDIVGDGPNRQEYEELSERLGLDTAVTFHGQKPKEEVADFMRNCDFYVQSSLWENLANVLMEAAACGKPVIATDVGGTREIVDSENGVLVPPDDAKALRDAVEYMLDNCQKYSADEIARAARERFSYEAVGKKIDAVYRELTTS